MRTYLIQLQDGWLNYYHEQKTFNNQQEEEDYINNLPFGTKIIGFHEAN